MIVASRRIEPNICLGFLGLKVNRKIFLTFFIKPLDISAIVWDNYNVRDRRKREWKIKNQKRIYLKNWVEKALTTIVLVSIMFIAITIETLGNPVYDRVLVVAIIIDVVIMKVLCCYGKEFNKDND